jgi:hypothetical protein
LGQIEALSSLAGGWDIVGVEQNAHGG